MAKKDFSIGDALGTGFDLFRRHPAAVLGWGALYVVAIAAYLGYAIYFFSRLSFENMTATAADFEELEAMMGFQLGMWAIALLLGVVGLLIWNAATRAALHAGRTDRFLFLRLGMAELRLLVVAIALLVAYYAFIIVAALLGVGIGLASYAIGESAVPIALVIYGVAVFGLLVVGWARLSILPAACMIYDDFAFVAGWRLGAGRTAKLVGLNLLILILYYVASIIMVLLAGLIAVGVFFGTGASLPENPQTFGDVFDALRPIAPWLVLVLAFYIPFMGWVMAMYSGGLTTAARQLADSSRPAQTVADAADASR
jgi:hypothetical protein